MDINIYYFFRFFFSELTSRISLLLLGLHYLFLHTVSPVVSFISIDSIILLYINKYKNIKSKTFPISTYFFPLDGFIA